MIKSLYPKALIYKEWHQKRWIALLAFLLVAPSVFFNTIGPALNPHRAIVITSSLGPSQHVDIVAQNFSYFCNQLLGRSTVGWWASLIFVGLASYSLWTERRGESFYFALSGPVSRASVIRTKVAVDFGILVGIFTVLALSLCVIDGAVQAHYNVLGILRWWLVEIAVQGAMYGLGFLFAVLTSNAVISGLLTFGMSWVPIYVGVIMVRNMGMNLISFGGPKTVPWTWNLMWVISHLSPVNWFSLMLNQAWVHPARYVIGFLLFAMLCCYLAQVLYVKIETERIDYLFPFRATGPILGLLCCGVIGFVCSRFMVDRVRRDFTQIAVCLGLALILWCFLLYARSRMARLR